MNSILNQSLINKSYVALSSEFFFHVKANNFYQESKEKVFSDIFEEMLTSINGFSQNIHKIGGYVPQIFWKSPTVDLSIFSHGIWKLSHLSKIDDNELVPVNLNSFIDVLNRDSNTCVKTLEEILELSDNLEYNQFIQSRIDSHKNYQNILQYKYSFQE